MVKNGEGGEKALWERISFKYFLDLFFRHLSFFRNNRRSQSFVFITSPNVNTSLNRKCLDSRIKLSVDEKRSFLPSTPVSVGPEVKEKSFEGGEIELGLEKRRKLRF